MLPGCDTEALSDLFYDLSPEWRGECDKVYVTYGGTRKS